MKRIPILAIATTAVAFIAGCGSDQVEVFPVTGTVSYLGSPMKGGGSISFVPTGGQQGKAPGGVINEDGTFTLATYGDNDGAMPGEYRVVVMQSTYDEPAITQDGEAPAGEPVEKVPPEARIPLIYSDPANSPLTATIRSDGETVLDLQLEEQEASTPQWGA